MPDLDQLSHRQHVRHQRRGVPIGEECWRAFLPLFTLLLMGRDRWDG